MSVRHLLRIVLLSFQGAALCLAGCGCDESVSGKRGPSLVMPAAKQYRYSNEIGKKSSFTFQLTNSGQQTLHIINVKRSCTCLSFTLSGREIRPGCTETLVMELLAEHYGLNTQWVALSTNEEGKPVHVLEATEELVPDVVCMPSDVSQELYLGQCSRRTIKVHMVRPHELGKVKKAAEWIAVLQVLSGEEPELRLQLCARHLSIGEYRDVIVLELDNGKYPAVAVPVHMRVRSPLAVVPSKLFLGANRRDGVAGQCVAVSVSGKPADFADIQVLPTDLLAYSLDVRGEKSMIWIGLKDPGFVGVISGELRMKITAEPGDVVVPITGYIPPPVAP